MKIFASSFAMLFIGTIICKGETVRDKIARAMSAGPPDIAKSAKIVDTDAQGKMIVLRDGTNGSHACPGILT